MKRNRFTRALHHLNKKHVVESAPTNNTTGVFNVTPSGVGPVGWTDRTFTTDISGNPIPSFEVADFTVGENPENSTEAQDTSGLFEDDGVTVKTLTPPGDNSYILGPFSSMWYAWGNFTTLGYIRQSDRRMVNLGTITGKLSDWDGSSINSYGQLTLEQALWFRDVDKFGGIDNDPANHNYRAFYPGPPSTSRDAFGRYLCVIADSRAGGGSETRPGAPDNPTQPDGMNPFDNLSALLARLKNLGGRGLDAITALGDFAADPLGSIADFVKNDLVDLYDKFSDTTLSNDVLEPTFEKFGQILGSKTGFVLGIVTTAANDIRSFIGGKQNQFGDRPAFSSSNNQFSYAINLAMSLAQSIGNGRPVVMDNSVVSSQTVAQNISVNDINMMHQTNQTPQNGMPNVGMGVDDILNPNKDGNNKKPYMGDGFGGEGGSILTPFIDNKGDLKLSNVADKTFRLGGESGEGFDINTQTFTDIPSSGNAMGIVDEVVSSGQFADGLTKLFNQQTNDANYNSALVDNITNTVTNSPTYQNLMTVLDNDTIGGSFVKGSSTGAVNGAAAGALLYNQIKVKLGLMEPTPLQNAGGFGHVRRETIINVDDLKPEVKNKLNELYNLKESYSKKILSESRKKHILREIKKPTSLPEAKKKFKVKPKVLGHPSNKTLSNQMKDTTPNVAFKKEIPVWSMDQKIRNARSSQDKKNEVLEYLGSSGDHWNYMTKTIKEHNRKIINLNYGGKEKKVTRKEQVDKDTLVFMEDELGNKSSALQSKINEMQAEAGDNEMFAKYYEMHPQKKSLFKEVVKRGVFDYKGKPSKKGYPDKEPAQLDPKTGMHPEYGKKYKYDKLDPQSAESMPMQGDPEIDANITKNLNPESKKRKTKVLNQPNG